VAARWRQVREWRIGILTPFTDDDPESLKRRAAFVGRLREHGWVAGSNLRIDYRWGAGDADGFRKYAAELVALRRTSSWQPAG
jgi:putative ABC transport system substrate-binding protein